MAIAASQAPADYTRHRALELRHDWQLSRLFLPAESRDAFGTLLALRVELAGQLATVSEPAIGMAKLEWWRNEIERGFDNSAQHPLAIHLGAVLGAQDIAVEYVIEQVDAIEMAFLPGGIASAADEKLFRYRRDGVLAEIALQLSRGEFDIHDRNLLAAARAIGDVRAHADAMLGFRHGFTGFSQESLARFDIDAAGRENEIGAAVENRGLDDFLAEQWHRWDELRIAARTAMDNLALPPALFVQWQLLEADYRALAQRKASLKSASPRVPGHWRRLFIAWRAARKSARQQIGKN